MGLETAPQNPLGRIDPRSLIGLADPAVTPSAVEALSDSVRKGFITAEDIKARIEGNPAAAAKQKAEVQLATEFTSPEAIKQRKEALELKSAQDTFGVNLQAFQALAPEAGITQPMTADGRPDYAKMAELGAQLSASKAKQKIALGHLTAVGAPIKGHDKTGQEVIFYANQFGEIIDDDLKAKFSQDLSPFKNIAPGTTADMNDPNFAFPGTTRATPVPPPELQIQPRTQADAVQRDAAIQTFLPSQIVSKQAAKPVVEVPVGKPLPGGGINLGLEPQKGAAKTAQEVSGELAESMETLSTIAKVRPLSQREDVVGPRGGSKLFSEVLNPVAAFFGIRTDQYQSQDQLAQAVNKRVLEGAQKLKGNLSDKDIRFLQASYPKLSSTSATWDAFLNSWDRIIRKNIDVLNGVAPRGSTALTADEEKWIDATESVATTGGQFGVPKPVVPVQGVPGEIKTLPSGRRMQWDGNKFVYVP